MRKLLALLTVLALVPSCSWASTAINESSFPDTAFRELVRNFDTNNDGTLQDEEISAVNAIHASRLGISSMKGIEFFTALTSLECSDNNFTALDLQHNTLLESLACDRTPLESLNITACAKLKTLFCVETALKTLDVTRCPELQELYCYVNSLDILNVSNNTALVSLDCQENNIAAIDLTWNRALEYLDVSGNRINSLNLSSNTALKYLICRDLDLSASGLNVKNLPALRRLWCWNDGLTSLDLSGQDSLAELLCGDNPITGSININSVVPYGELFSSVERRENITSTKALDKQMAATDAQMKQLYDQMGLNYCHGVE